MTLQSSLPPYNFSHFSNFKDEDRLIIECNQVIVKIFESKRKKVVWKDDNDYEVHNLELEELFSVISDLTESLGPYIRSHDKTFCPEFFVVGSKLFYRLNKCEFRTTDCENHEIFYQIIKNLDCEDFIIMLPSGKQIKFQDFIGHRCFATTKEAKGVFLGLFFTSTQKNALNDYMNFLESLIDSNWHLNFKHCPKKLAYFSIIAFLDKKIDLEELFVINIVADAYHELSSNVIAKVTVDVLTTTNAATILRDGCFPLFGKGPEYPQIRNRKPEKLLVQEKTDFLANLTNLSIVKRTFVEYTIDGFELDWEKLRRSNLCSIEQGIYIKTGGRIGYKNVGDNQATIVLLPPKICIDLLQRTSCISCLPYEAHEYIFGFTHDTTQGYRGIRIVSIPSPLFETVFVHGYNSGAKGLQRYHSDISYHMPLEMNNPHIENIVRIANKFKAFADNCQSNTGKQYCELLSERLVEREAFHYRYLQPEHAFDSFLIDSINFVSKIIQEMKNPE